MTEQRAPAAIVEMADARRAARGRRDWAEADRLRAAIEAAGWRVVDRGTAYRLAPAHPPTVVQGGQVRYGRAEDVPTRLDEAPVGLASIVIVATDWPEDVSRALGHVAGNAPEGTQVVIVANGPSMEQAATLEVVDAVDPGAPGVRTDVVWLSARLGHATAVNAGLRRTSAAVCILLDPSVEPTGDFVTPLVAALDDPTVAVAGGFGIVSGDLRRFEAAPAGDVDAVEAYCMAFRRADVRARGPLDEKFAFYRNLDIWWSLVLRDEGEGHVPRRALALDLLLLRHVHRGFTSLPEDEVARLSKRNFFRILDRFRDRPDLLVAGPLGRQASDRPSAT
ncbi:MAG TPA: glycosyltransferase [Candidatus Limnocylindrales bacterium]